MERRKNKDRLDSLMLKASDGVLKYGMFRCRVEDQIGDKLFRIEARHDHGDAARYYRRAVTRIYVDGIEHEHIDIEKIVIGEAHE